MWESRRPGAAGIHELNVGTKAVCFSLEFRCWFQDWGLVRLGFKEEGSRSRVGVSGLR